VIEVADIDEDSEQELEDIETPDVQRRSRWRRVAQAATKQCLRCVQHLGAAFDCHCLVCKVRWK